MKSAIRKWKFRTAIGPAHSSSLAGRRARVGEVREGRMRCWRQKSDDHECSVQLEEDGQNAGRVKGFYKLDESDGYDEKTDIPETVPKRFR